jgi:hypothetical protein
MAHVERLALLNLALGLQDLLSCLCAGGPYLCQPTLGHLVSAGFMHYPKLCLNGKHSATLSFNFTSTPGILDDGAVSSDKESSVSFGTSLPGGLAP